MAFFLFSLYFSGLIHLGLTNNSIVLCGVLVSNTALLVIFTHMLFGFAWYAILFSLVYLGGVFILFIYITVFDPNAFPGGLGIVSRLLLFILIVILFYWGGFYEVATFDEFAHYICTTEEGHTYVMYCLMTLVVFAFVTMIGGGKGSFFR
uniref:NADH dehydrogenase subunit 6 n=1 Tax=Tamerlania zarudnyi TaxID=138578 RepID=A0A894JKC5_9TREM|nr:NADH dehydrogenase subunit 6 [Tamerlania zarudnyi]QRV61249.1 NADH dehydrogenase subunit 6 [Tamerlania zarudnyi]